MLTIADDVAGKPRAAGKWSRKEIVGHLIDSAVNNQARFVRAQVQKDLVFDGYDQEAWVRVQRYQERPWAELVRAWQVYNAQVAAIMRNASQAEIARARSPHNLDRIGFKSLPPGTRSDAWLSDARLRQSSAASRRAGARRVASTRGHPSATRLHPTIQTSYRSRDRAGSET